MQSPQIASKLPNTGITIFTEMSALAQQYKAINLGQGFPDFDMSEELIGLVNKAMVDGHNQYAPRNGIMELKEILSQKVYELYNKNLDPSLEICITPGATYAIYTALTAVLRPGDEVIVFEPAYDSYLPNIEINGAVPVLIPLPYPNYKINWDEVRERITPATKMIIINSPHNPTGTIISKHDIDELRKTVEGTGIFILSDEVYEHLTYDGFQHESILKYPDLFERSFVTFSFGKVFNCTGWKMGYCVAPKNLLAEFLKIHQYNCFCCNTPMQYGLAEFLKNRNHYLSLSAIFQKKRNYFNDLMKNSRLKPIPTGGSYFQLFNYSALSQEKEINFARKLCIDGGVAVIPTSAFYRNPVENKVVRFCFAKKESTLKMAVDRLLQFEAAL